jgi:hypothetical protein
MKIAPTLVLLAATCAVAAIAITAVAGAAEIRALPKLQCLAASAKPSRLPAQLPVGVETIHRDATKIITIFVPLAPPEAASRMMDTNSKNPEAPLAERFAISDGTVRTSFIGVDTQKGGTLDLCLKEILRRLPTRKPEGVLDYLRDHLQENFLRDPPQNYVYSWDKDRKSDAPELTELYHAAKDMTVGQYPLRSKQTDDVVPLEKFLEAGYGTCLHNAILASLLLTRLGIKHRLVNGATQKGGHTWIALDDGRILDPSLRQLDRAEASQALPGWIKYGDTFVFENQVWPYLALD